MKKRQVKARRFCVANVLFNEINSPKQSDECFGEGLYPHGEVPDDADNELENIKEERAYL